MTLFEKGRPKTGGRARGAKNRLSHAFLTALAEDFEQHGVEALKIARVEKPVEYIRHISRAPAHGSQPGRENFCRRYGAGATSAVSPAAQARMARSNL